MHVATIKKRHVDKAGLERVYESHLLRRTFREGGKVKHETLANLSALPDEQVELLRASLRGESFVAAAAAARVLRPCRMAMWPRSWRKRGRWVCRSCSARLVGTGMWPWR
jgi:hypothetical protein